jgi:hypothetical protein
LRVARPMSALAPRPGRAAAARTVAGKTPVVITARVVAIPLYSSY